MKKGLVSALLSQYYDISSHPEGSSQTELAQKPAVISLVGAPDSIIPVSFMITLEFEM